MELTYRETWAVLHGLVFGTVFLLAFAGGLAELWAFRPGHLTAVGIRRRMRRIYLGMWGMAVVAWITVISGTWIVYPWYREKIAGSDYEGCAGMSIPDGVTCSPRDFLLSDVSGNTTDWHHFGMEWKEHVAWISPILATVVAFIVVYYGTNLIRHDRVRRTAMTLFVLAFGFAAAAGAFGAFITKVAPVK